MPAFPQNVPNVGEQVEITLANGSKFMAYYDGLQWWMGVNDDPNDVPVTNEFVVSWQTAPQG
jgi:phage baseplate assembly protein gpV